MLPVLIMLLSACGSNQATSRPVMPPLVYLQEVPEPQFHGRTNGDLLAWALELREALRLANYDKAALRQWVEEGQK